jgi:ATP-dependent Lon protease
VILPQANRKGVGHDVPKEVRVRPQFVTVKTVREVLDTAFGPGSLLWLADAQPLVESRLQETGESKRNERMEWR